jgi:hypothetical protein
MHTEVENKKHTLHTLNHSTSPHCERRRQIISVPVSFIIVKGASLLTGKVERTAGAAGVRESISVGGLRKEKKGFVDDLESNSLPLSNSLPVFKKSQVQ